MRYGCLRQGEAVALVQAILSSGLPTYGLSEADVPVGDAKLNKAEFRAWLTKWRIADRLSMTVDEAARCLKVKQQVAYQLVKAGLLPACNDHRKGWQVTMDGVNRFRQEFVSLADLARECARAPRWLLENLSAAPVCGPTVDRTRQYFYRRVDLLSRKKSAHDGLDSGFAVDDQGTILGLSDCQFVLTSTKSTHLADL